jgi:hypothetical protein
LSDDLEQKDVSTTDANDAPDRDTSSDRPRESSLRQDLRAAWKEVSGSEPDDGERQREERRQRDEERERVDLDRAYEVACSMTPAIAEKLYQRRVAAANKQARDQADKSRRAGISFGPTSPGRGSGSSSTKPTKGRTVRESLLESIEQARTGSRI